MIQNGPPQPAPFPPGPYTEEQLVLLERGWHGRPTMQTVVAELRRQMEMAKPDPQVGWPCSYPEPAIITDPSGEGPSYILLFEEHEISFDDARGIGQRLIRMADEGDRGA